MMPTPPPWIVCRLKGQPEGHFAILSVSEEHLHVTERVAIDARPFGLAVMATCTSFAACCAALNLLNVGTPWEMPPVFECGHEVMPDHTCPFKVEIQDNAAECRCCDACRRECAENV